MNQEYNQQLKKLFRSNTIDNIKLALTLALSQGYTWNEIAIKCLEEWLLFKRYQNYWNHESELNYHYCFVPNEFINNGPGNCIFMIHINNDEFRIKAQLYINEEFIEDLEKNLYSDDLTKLKENCIKRMERFIKLIYEGYRIGEH